MCGEDADPFIDVGALCANMIHVVVRNVVCVPFCLVNH